MKFSFKLNAKLVLVTASIIVAALGTNMLLNLFHFSTLYKRSIAEVIFARMHRLEDTIKDIIDLGLELGELKGLDQECQEVIRSIPFSKYCFVMDETGKVSYHNDINEKGKVYSDVFTQKAIENYEKIVQLIPFGSKEKVYDFSLPILTNDNECIGIIRVGVSSEIINKELFRLRDRTLILAAVFILIAILVIFVFDRMIISKPIISLMGGIQQFGKGNFDYRIHLKGEDEFARLASAFNKMAFNLEKITASRDDLNSEMAQCQQFEQEIKNANEELQASERALKNMLYDLRKANEDLKKAQSQLVQSEKMAAIGQLAAGVAHEVKNPLAIILLSVDSLEAKISNLTEDEKKYIDMVRSAASRANKIIIDLLNFSRFSKMVFKFIKIHAVLDKSIELVSNAIKGKNIVIERRYCDKIDLLVNGDNLLLEQVFINLLTNAIDAMAGEGKIIIKTSFESTSDELNLERQNLDDKVIIEVIDTGSGMAKENLLKVFEPFFTTKEQGKGTGLGLSTVYMILEKHQGSIEAESELGKGSTFIVTLPVKK